jgi:hypothetical protein
VINCLASWSAPTALVVPRKLEIVALVRHADCDPADAGPGVQPCAQRPEGAVVRRSGEPGEADSRLEELAAWVEHALLDDGSARASTDGGIVSPSALAVFRLMTRSNFVGCSTGRSAGLAPLRSLSTYVAARWYRSARLAP